MKSSDSRTNSKYKSPYGCRTNSHCVENKLISPRQLSLKNLTHPLCIASLYYCYYPGTLDVHSLYGHRYTCSGKHVVMEVDPDASDVDQLSEVNVTGDEEVQGQKNAHGSLIGANSREIRRETAIVTESGLPGTSQNINRVVRISPSQI